MSLSLVTYNGLRWLPGCLTSIQQQILDAYELLVLDNASADGSGEWLGDWATRDERMTVELLDRNIGYSAGHNRNIRLARADFVVLLNQDVELDPRFLLRAVAAFHGRPRLGSVQARVRRLAAPQQRSEILDTTGLEIHRDRRVTSLGQGRRDGKAYELSGPLWGVDGPVPVYRRAALLDAALPRKGGGWEVLDEDFFAYKEDVDLAWRLRLLGWEAWYEPTALAWHARTAAGPTGNGWRQIVRRNRVTPPEIRALSWRNQRLMQVKNDPLGSVLHDLPWILRRELLASAYVALADPRRLAAIPELLRRLPDAMRKRRVVQQRRRTRLEAGVDSPAKGTHE